MAGLPTWLSAEEFQVRVVDAETKKPISVRMSIRNSRNALIKQRGVPYHGGNFCFFGQHTFKLPRGVYSYTIEKGLEYRTVSGQFEIKRDANDGVTVSVPRFTSMAQRGWWSGDLSIQRPQSDLPVLMDANDLSFGNLIAASNSGVLLKDGFPKNPIHQVNERIAFSQSGVLDSRNGGNLIWVAPSQQSELPKEGSILPLRTLATKGNEGAFVFVRNSTAWDLPVLLADSKLHADRKLNGIGIASGVQPKETKNSKAKINVPDFLRPVPDSFAGEHRFARWQLAIYFHALNCGFQIPPVACSDSGDSALPVGHNRIYVHSGAKYDPEKWIANLKLGRTIVTNGPVMNILYNGLLPGETFLVDQGKEIEIEPTLTLSLKEKAEYLEIIRNGFVAEKISLDDYAKARGRLPKVRFTESGWMAVRVVTNNKDEYRFALSAPIYVKVGTQPVLKKDSAQFFLDWIVERARMIQNSTGDEKKEAIEQMRPAYEYWKKLVDEARNQ